MSQKRRKLEEGETKGEVEEEKKNKNENKKRHHRGAQQRMSRKDYPDKDVVVPDDWTKKDVELAKFNKKRKKWNNKLIIKVEKDVKVYSIEERGCASIASTVAGRREKGEHIYKGNGNKMECTLNAVNNVLKSLELTEDDMDYFRKCLLCSLAKNAVKKMEMDAVKEMEDTGKYATKKELLSHMFPKLIGVTANWGVEVIQFISKIIKLEVFTIVNSMYCFTDSNEYSEEERVKNMREFLNIENMMELMELYTNAEKLKEEKDVDRPCYVWIIQIETVDYTKQKKDQGYQLHCISVDMRGDRERDGWWIHDDQEKERIVYDKENMMMLIKYGIHSVTGMRAK
jgi:hypothetical protein